MLGPGIPQAPARRAFGEQWRAWTISFLENRPPLTQLDEARDLLDLLRAARDEDSNGAFPKEVIVDQVGTMMAAGFETTAVALFWVALLLAQFPGSRRPSGTNSVPTARTRRPRHSFCARCRPQQPSSMRR